MTGTIVLNRKNALMVADGILGGLRYAGCEGARSDRVLPQRGRLLARRQHGGWRDGRRHRQARRATLHADGALAGYPRSPHPCPSQASFARDAVPGGRRLTGSLVEEAG